MFGCLNLSVFAKENNLILDGFGSPSGKQFQGSSK